MSMVQAPAQVEILDEVIGFGSFTSEDLWQGDY